MRRGTPFTVGLLAILASGAFAAETPREGRQDTRVRFVDYDPHQVFEIWGALRHSTQIQFAADEIVVHAAVGNFVWEVAPTGNIVFLKPKEAHPPTNLQVVTQRADGGRRSYQFVLASYGPEAKRDHAPFLLVQFRYPSDEEARRRAVAAARVETDQAAVADRLLKRDEVNGPRNFAYSVQGQADFEPVEVWDNGKVTSLRFKGGTELPAIYLAREDGSEELVPKNVQGEIVMLHTLARKLVLRRGDEVMCFFNENFIADGLDPRTGTTSPQVARVVKQAPRTAKAGSGVPQKQSAAPAAVPAAASVGVQRVDDRAVLATGSAGLPVSKQ
jgi:type IV secretion system protein VirB9